MLTENELRADMEEQDAGWHQERAEWWRKRALRWKELDEPLEVARCQLNARRHHMKFMWANQRATELRMTLA